MMNLIRDIPFADLIGPAILAAILWCGVHILTMAPDILAPRLTAKIYAPRCEAGINTARDTAILRQRQKARALYEARIAELRRKTQLTGALLGQFLGPDIARSLNRSGLLDPLKHIPREILQPQNTVNIPNVDASEYCGCIISELLGNQISVGLYSASMRLWKPETILTLERLNHEQPRSAQCRAPRFAQ